ncbi:MAG: hypothetical protein PHH47_11100 [Gallionella sp.]|nr:hypothetical protein [Gallionella sp.]MDD4946987.1 hypothetical protein [Gallionella sp.]MDD5612577.1 hypothetical protein [Gallionella sp.]
MRFMPAWGVLGLLLSACSSPDFAHPPPEVYAAPLPGVINGTWKNEEDNGVRVRLQSEPDGALRMYFSAPPDEAEPPPPAPFVARTMHFDNSDWLLLDMRAMAEWQGEKFPGNASYILIRVELENPDRLCGIELNATLFMEAINSGKLAGSVEQKNQYLPPKVIVTAPGTEWVKWWQELPAAARSDGPRWCFQRDK